MSISSPTHSSTLLESLRGIVGRRHLLTGAKAMRYASGYRFGSGPVTAVVRPSSLVEQWRVLQACVAADHIVITQAANTGLTGGSTPDGVYDRNVVIVNTLRIKGIHLLRGGKQVICLSGATLNTLEQKLLPLGRDPHSIIGSSCIGASVIGGVCNNSGGSLVQRGPAYTEYALFARVTNQGELKLCNHLGLRFKGSAEAILASVEGGDFSDADIVADDLAASAVHYAARVRDVDATTPARFNSDPTTLYEASGCAGRIMVFAVRLDTFPREARHKTYYIGTNHPEDFTALRRQLLTQCKTLPVSGEYVHRDAYDMAANYGKDIFLAIRMLGTERLPWLYAVKSHIDLVVRRFRFLPATLSDQLLQIAADLFPHHLPDRMTKWRQRFEHHLFLKMSGDGIEQASEILNALFPSASGDFFECTEQEAKAAFLHRFAVAGAAVRYRALHPMQVEGIVAIDIALRRDDQLWVDRLPQSIKEKVSASLYYGHFLCHVFHQDYIVRKGVDAHALEQEMLVLLDARGAEYPAEHNVGHLYAAKPPLVDQYRALDPTNSMNPGIGKTSRNKCWH